MSDDNDNEVFLAEYDKGPEPDYGKSGTGILGDPFAKPVPKTNGTKKPVVVELKPLPFTLASAFSLSTHDDFLIEDYWQARGIHLLYAAKDRYKSFMACDIAMSVATGKDWHGHKAKQGPVVYIAGEGNSGIQARVIGWCLNHSHDINDVPLALSTMPMQVLDEPNIIEWRHFIKRVCEHWGNPAMVIIDTLSTNFGPGDENKPTDMARFISHIKIHIEVPFETSVLIVHHTGKDEERGARGGSPITANSEEIYTITKPDNDGRIINLVCKNVKDRERPPDKTFDARTQFLGEVDSRGRDMATLVLVEVDGELGQMPEKSDTGKGIGEKQKKGLRILKEMYAKHESNRTKGGAAPGEALVYLSEWINKCVDGGLNRSTMTKWPESMAKRGLIVIEHPFVRLPTED